MLLFEGYDLGYCSVNYKVGTESQAPGGNQTHNHKSLKKEALRSQYNQEQMYYQYHYHYLWHQLHDGHISIFKVKSILACLEQNKNVVVEQF